MFKKILMTTVLATTTLIATGETGSDKFTEFVGKAAPKFSMTTTEGKTLDNKKLKGKVVLLDFWATWCGPCKMASPGLQSLHEEYSKKGLVVIGANAFERGDTTGENAKEYKKDHKYTYTMTYGNDKLATKWGITSIPAFILIGPDGNVAKVYQGFSAAQEKQMKKDVKALLPPKKS